ncbi:hypothetical protein [Rhodopirellula bahusiensis]|uniref:Uncharacterized protein n=1 Tax=Rhodopirellula bahusiensis TaxID=2014065 RepID=A0A2G1W2Q7_9BACT|nr:hypothetical protein [Rhodopirellula bahusiensis]PHQ33312.1 hypothetical protein CEE69_21570 [Rhodopirellula bahusiensis]
MTHRIRLRRPWTREVFRDGQLIDQADRVDVPDASETPEISANNNQSDETRFEYHAIYRRHFNCPTGLEEGDQVSIEMVPAPNRWFVVRLNDEVIGSSDLAGLAKESDRESIRLQIPEPLMGQNQIEIELRSEVTADLPLCTAEVALRIDAAG